MVSLGLKTEARLAWSIEKLQREEVSHFRSYGNSMKPFIREGDLVEVLSYAPGSLIRIGDIILARAARGLVMHRVIKKLTKNGRLCLVTQGDAAFYPDPSIYPEDILGKVIGVKRNGKRIRFDRGLYYGIGFGLGHLAFLTRWINRTRIRHIGRKPV
jgi:signal peptidase I